MYVKYVKYRFDPQYFLEMAHKEPLIQQFLLPHYLKVFLQMIFEV